MLVWIEPFNSENERVTCKYGFFVCKLADKSFSSPCNVEITVMDTIEYSSVVLSEKEEYSAAYVNETNKLCTCMEAFEQEEDSALAWFRFDDLLIPITVTKDQRFNKFVGKYVVIKLNSIVVYPYRMP